MKVSICNLFDKKAPNNTTTLRLLLHSKPYLWVYQWTMGRKNGPCGRLWQEPVSNGAEHDVWSNMAVRQNAAQKFDKSYDKIDKHTQTIHFSHIRPFTSLHLEHNSDFHAYCSLLSFSRSLYFKRILAGGFSGRVESPLPFNSSVDIKTSQVFAFAGICWESDVLDHFTRYVHIYKYIYIHACISTHAHWHMRRHMTYISYIICMLYMLLLYTV